MDIFDWDKTGSDDKIATVILSPGEVLKMARKLNPGLPFSPTISFEQIIKLKTKVNKKAGSTLTLAFALTWPQELMHLPPQSKEAWLKRATSKVDAKLKEFDIHQNFYQDLNSLNSFDIVLVLDDSGSMNASAGGGKTRWQELKEITKMVVEIATGLDDDGLDAIFLNRGTKSGIKSFKDLKDAFEKDPGGLTPLTAATKAAFSRQKGKPLLVIIATDGVPNNLKGVYFSLIFSTSNTFNSNI